MIRALRNDDLPALARLWRELRPDAVHSELGLRHLVKSFPPRAQAEQWVVDDGGVVGWAFAHRRWWRASSNAYVWVGVLPDARLRGLGGALWELAERHVRSLGVERVNADAVGDTAGERFLRRRGFEHARTVVISAVEPDTVDPAELPRRRAQVEVKGYGLARYADVDLAELYRLDLEASDDAPGDDAPPEISFDEWRRDLLEQPDLTHEGSFVVVRGGELVAYSALSVDPGSRRGRNEGTGTARSHRGRGLASFAKLAQLRWAAEQGIERVITDNDEHNAPMLAINRRLGYVPFTERKGFVREETGAGGARAAPAP